MNTYEIARKLTKWMILDCSTFGINFACIFVVS